MSGWTWIFCLQDQTKQRQVCLFSLPSLGGCRSTTVTSSDDAAALFKTSSLQKRCSVASKSSKTPPAGLRCLHGGAIKRISRLYNRWLRNCSAALQWPLAEPERLAAACQLTFTPLFLWSSPRRRRSNQIRGLMSNRRNIHSVHLLRASSTCCESRLQLHIHSGFRPREMLKEGMRWGCCRGN